MGYTVSGPTSCMAGVLSPAMCYAPVTPPAAPYSIKGWMGNYVFFGPGCLSTNIEIESYTSFGLCVKSDNKDPTAPATYEIVTYSADLTSQTTFTYTDNDYVNCFICLYMILP